MSIGSRSTKSLRLALLLYAFGTIILLIDFTLSINPLLGYVSGGVATVLYAFACVYDTRRITAFSLLAINISGGYIFGPLLAVIELGANGVAPWTLQAAGSQHAYVFASSLGCLVVLVLIGLGELWGIAIFEISRFSSAPVHVRLSIVAIVLTFLIVLATASGQVGYMGLMHAVNSSRTGILGSLGETALAISPMLLIAWFATGSKGKFTVAILVVTLASISVLTIITGRRYLLTLVIDILLGYFVFWGRRFFKDVSLLRHGLIKKAIIRPLLISLLLGYGMILGAKGFQDIREASYYLGARASPMTLVEFAIEHASTSAIQNAQYRIQSAQRIASLPAYLGAILETKGYDKFGVCFARGFVTAIPRLFLPGKIIILNRLRCSKADVADARGLVAVDSPVTLLTYGFLDFGMLGLFLYPIGFAFLFNSITAVARANAHLSIYVAAMSVATLTYIEQDIAFYFVNIRNAFIIILLCNLIFGLFLKMRIRTRRSIAVLEKSDI